MTKLSEIAHADPVLARVPVHMLESIDRYLTSRIPTGSFLEAVLSNDLRDAAARGDAQNQRLLFEYAYLMHNYMPIGSHGSREAVSAWLKGDRDAA